MLNSKQIEVFYTVYKEGSLTRAARSLNVSQPSISNSLRYSELKLNLKLFLRRGRKLIPTPEADILYKHAEAFNKRYLTLIMFLEICSPTLRDTSTLVAHHLSACASCPH